MLFLHETDSTNRYLRLLLKQDLVWDGFCVSAAYQTHGKGQFGRLWQSEHYKNVMLSVAISLPKRKFEQQYFACNAIAIDLICNIIQYHIPFSIKIKWPNDIYVENKKIAGVLIEIIPHQGHHWAIIGIGLNLNQTHFDGALNATSLALLTKTSHHLLEILFTLEKHIQTDLFYQQEWKTNYTHRLLFQEEFIPLRMGKKYVKAKIIALMDDGSLGLLTSEGEKIYTHHHQLLNWEKEK